MRTSARRLTAAALAMVVAFALLHARVKVQVHVDKDADFSRFKTWSWNATSPGQVKIVITRESQSEPTQRTYEPVIMQAVEERFAERGYVKAAAGAPSDFNLTYYVLIYTGNSSQYMGQFLPSYAQFGIPLFAPQTTAIAFYPQGTFVLDVASPAPGDVVWRGVAEAKVEVESTEARRTVRIKDIVKDVVSKFPKLPKAK